MAETIDNDAFSRRRRRRFLIIVGAAVLATIVGVALLMNIFERKQEARTAARSFMPSADLTVDLFDLRRSHTWLDFLVDAEYGSATFIDVQSPALFEVRVSTTGLLVRSKPAPAAR